MGTCGGWGLCLDGPGISRNYRLLVRSGCCEPWKWVVFPCLGAVLGLSLPWPSHLCTFLSNGSLCPSGELSCGARGPEWGLDTDWGACRRGPSTSQNSRSLLIGYPVTTRNGLPCSVQMPCQIQAGCVPHDRELSSAVAAFALAWNHTVERVGLEEALDVGWGTHWVVMASVCCFCLVLGVSTCVCVHSS